MVFDGPKFTYPDDIERNIRIHTIAGGRAINPQWTSTVSADAFGQSLEKSLESQHLLSGAAELRLDATLLEVSEPPKAFDMEVAVTVHYLLVNDASGETIFDEKIVSPYLAGIEDALLSGERLKLASEGAMLANIERFLNELSVLDRGVRTSAAGLL